MEHAGTSSRPSVYQKVLAKLCYRPAFPKRAGKTMMGRNVQNATGQKGGDNLSGQPAVKATQPSIGVPVIADEGKRIKTPANDREGEELVIVEPAEDVMITQAPTEVPLSETGPDIADGVRCTDIIADEREGKEVAADEPADDILVTEAPSGAPPSETGPGIAEEVKCTKTPAEEREGKELAANASFEPAKDIPVTEAPVEAPPSGTEQQGEGSTSGQPAVEAPQPSTDMPSSGDTADNVDTSSATQSPQQEEQT